MNGRVSFGVRAGFWAAVLALAAPAVFAQSAGGRIEGVVTDSTGAAAPGASVTATNLGTNAARTVATDKEGGYVITPLAVGDYRVQVELSGFKPTATRLTLNVNQVARVDLTLELGTMAEVVEVTGGAPVIDKSTSFIGTVIDSQQVEDLPLNGRNFTQLATLSPGVHRGVPGGQASGSRNETETFRYNEVGGGAISVNGLREQFNSFLLDGLDNNESLVNSIVFFPSVEALQEFRVMTTNAPAEFGRAGGAITSLVTKSGTNLFHGSLYEFNRSAGLAAMPTFAGADPADPDCANGGLDNPACSRLKPDFNRNQFGATLGGPILKDKTFFFFSYAGLRQTLPVDIGRRVSVPTAKMRTGDFSELLDPGFTGVGQPIIIYDPLTGRPFPGNIIPADRLDPVAVRYMNSFPLPDIAGRAQQNRNTNRQRKSTFNDFEFRVDHHFSSRDMLFARLSVADDENLDTGLFERFESGFGAGTAEAKPWGVALGHTHVFSDSLVNEFRAGYNRHRYAFLPIGFGEDQNAEFGIPGPGGRTFPNGQSLIGAFNTFFEYRGDFGEYVVRQKTFQVTDSLTWIRGSHTLKAGVSLIRRDISSTRDFAGKGFYFFSGHVSTPGNPPPPGQTGYEVSEVLIGRTDFTQTGSADFDPRHMIHWENSVFVQDDWRVNRDLTLNLGLRYDLFTPYYETDDRLANFDPATGRMVLAGQGSRSTVDTDTNNFGPRLGLAWQLDGKTVVRGAYGIFYSLDRGGIDNQLIENPPFKNSQFRGRGEPGGSIRLSDPIPLPDPVDPNNPGGKRVVYVPRDTDTTMVQQFNVGVQRELFRDTALMVAYVGTRGDNLTAVIGRENRSRITVANIAESKYDSLQVSLRRSATDLSLLASYTLGHATNNAPGPLSNTSLADTPTDPSGSGLDPGDADYDVRHRFTLAATWQLPFARESRLLGGWTLNTIVTLQTGTPFSAVADGDRRADLVPGQDPDAGPRTTEEWFNTAAFRPPAGRLGTSARNVLRGPGIKTVDASLFKTFKLMGRSNLELRFEVFNLTNTPQYANPEANVNRPNFGEINQTRNNTERQVQLAARFTF